jgi:hypothetical protein
MDEIAQEMGYNSDAELYQEIQDAEHVLRQRPTKDGRVQQQFKLSDFQHTQSYVIQNGVTTWEGEIQ